MKMCEVSTFHFFHCCVCRSESSQMFCKIVCPNFNDYYFVETLRRFAMYNIKCIDMFQDL